MQTMTKMQIQILDQMMDTWEEQIKSPNPSLMMSKLNSLPSFGPAGSWANLGNLPTMNPHAIYGAVAESVVGRDGVLD